MSTGNELVTIKQVDNYYKDLRKRSAPVIFNSAVGNPVVFSDGADGLPIQNLKVGLLPRQEGSGDPSPQNVRSILPWNGIKAWNSNKNMLGGNLLRDAIKATVPSAVDDPVNRCISFAADAATSTSSHITMFCGLEGKFKENTAYTFIFVYKNESANVANLKIRPKSGTDIHVRNGEYDSVSGKYTFIYTASETKQIDFIFKSNLGGTVYIYYDECGIFEGSLTLNDFVPYTGKETDITFPVGTNLFNPTIFSNREASGLTSVIQDNGKIAFYGTPTASVRYAQASGKYFTLPAGTYCIKGSPYNLRLSDEDNNQINTSGSTVITLERTTSFSIGIRGLTTGTAVSFEEEIMVASGDETVEWAKYIPSVFGGYADIVKGEGVATHNAYTFSSNIEYEIKEASDGTKYINAVVPGVKINDPSSICNMYPRTGSIVDGAFRITDSSIIIYDNRFTSQEALKEILNANPIVVVYENSNPISFILSQNSLQTALGNNTIWSDANGDIEVEYRADTKLFLDRNGVKDVRIDGTSITDDGVANVPMAGTDLGVSKVDQNYGVSIITSGDNIGKLRTYVASDDQLKAGVNTYRPISPSIQHKSVFYALAKLAGADMANSSNPVGQFTDEAKVAIQKMLGIYEAPWELIREDGFTKESTGDYVISVDSYGNPFALTDAIMLFELPTNSGRAEKGYYGQIWFYYDNETKYIAPEPGSFSREANADSKAAWFSIRCDNGMVVSQATLAMTNTNSQQVRWRYIQYTNSQADANMGIFINHNFSITKINIKSCLGECHYKLYGKRKWN